MAITIPAKMHNTIQAVIRSGIFTHKELKNIEAVVWYMRSIKEEEVAVWIETHPVSYTVGILSGFISDSSKI